MMKNMKRVALVGSILALSAVTVFAGAALAQGPGPANQAATGNAQANRHGRGGGGTGPGYGLAVKGAWGGAEHSRWWMHPQTATRCCESCARAS